MRKVIRIEPIKPLLSAAAVTSTRLRVAAYARVSTDQDAQKNSFEAQKDYYTKLITENPKWEFAGIYADNGISGTTSKKRPEFNRMMHDCRVGKIQMILTKSVSRFARNTVDSLNAIRELKKLGIGIQFEKEAIFTLDAKGEFLITLMSSLSQEESRSISENVRWGLRKKAADGKYSVAYSHFLGYDRGPDGHFVINEEQAVVVRNIFRLFLIGYSPTGIASVLMDNGIPTARGNLSWSYETVEKKICNESYKGDKLLQKSYIPDFLNKRQIKNHGEVQQYYVTAGHAAIVDPSLFDHVQETFQMRLNSEHGYSGMNPLSGKMICGLCGKPYGLRYWHGHPVWQCREKRIKNCTCKNIHIYDYALRVQLKEVLIRKLKRSSVIDTCRRMLEETVVDVDRQTAALAFMQSIDISQAESLAETEDHLMFIDRITVFPENYIEVKTIDGKAIKHALRRYTPSTGWLRPYNGKIQSAEEQEALMKVEQKTQVLTLWVDGLGYKRIAAITGLPLSTIKSHIKRHGYMNTPRVEVPIQHCTPKKMETKKGSLPCRHCGRPVPQTAGRKEKSFCCDKCRVTWFNRERSRKKQIMDFPSPLSF